MTGDLEEYRDFSWTVTAKPLTEADKLNGVLYRGTLRTSSKALRVMDAAKEQWILWQPDPIAESQTQGMLALSPMQVSNVNGKWDVQLFDVYRAENQGSCKAPEEFLARVHRSKEAVAQEKAAEARAEALRPLAEALHRSLHEGIPGNTTPEKYFRELEGLLNQGVNIDDLRGFPLPYRPLGETQDLRVVKFLIDHGADVNKPSYIDEWGKNRYALETAIAGCNSPLVEILAQRGARADLVTESPFPTLAGKSFLQLATELPPTETRAGGKCSDVLAALRRGLSQRQPSR